MLRDNRAESDVTLGSTIVRTRMIIAGLIVDVALIVVGALVIDDIGVVVEPVV